MTITRYANTPFDELLRLAEDSQNELLIELAQRVEQEVEEREEINQDHIHEEGYREGFRDGREDVMERVDGELCEACSKLMEAL